MATIFSKQIKRLPALVLAVAVICLTCPISFSASAATSGDFQYTVSGSNATITDYTGTATDLVIPATISWYTVTTIGEYAFAYCDSLTSVTIPDSVTTIGDKAFYSCDSLTSVVIPDSVTTIGDWAFASCDSLTSVVIPDSVTTIGDGAFRGCSQLQSIEVDDKNTMFADVDGVLFSKDQTLLHSYPGGKTDLAYAVPDSVTTIGDYAFEDCDSLTSVVIPDSMTTIGNDVFYDCDSLKSVEIPDSVTTIGRGAFRYCSSLTSVTIGNRVTTIGNSAFRDCTSLKSMTIPDSVTTIGDYAFRSCYSLKSVTIPDSVTTIGDGAFYNCDSLKSVVIPDGVTTIGNEAFYNCDSLEDIYYGGSKKQWNEIANDRPDADRIHYNTDGTDHWSLDTVSSTPTCEQYGRGNYSCACGYTVTRDIPATGHDYQMVKVVAPTCTADGYTVYQCTACQDTKQEDVVEAAHTIQNGACEYCSISVEQCLASPHNYPNNYDGTWIVRQEGAECVSLTFSNKTSTDDGYDFIDIYDGNDTLVGTYTGKELAGVTVTVTGDTVKIRLTSDDSMVDYGFAVTSVVGKGSIFGDVTGDGVLNMMDVVGSYNGISGNISLTDSQKAAADFNGDGKLNMMDVVSLYNKVSGR